MIRWKKGQHLTQEHRAYILRTLNQHPNEWSMLQRLFKLSKSTIRRLQKECEAVHQKEESKLMKSYGDYKLTSYAKSLVKDYIRPPTFPVTIGKLQSAIHSKMGEKYSIHLLRKFIRNELKYRFKKGSSRPPKYMSRRIQLVKALFWTELLSLLYRTEVVINVDESSFERSIKRQYSWLPKGKSSAIINDRLRGKASLILATWSNGKWFAMAIVGTVDSVKFCVFMRFLEFVIKSEQDYLSKLPTIIVDNAKTHTSKITKEVLSKLVFKTRYLAPYWPEVASVEQPFGIIKSKLRSVKEKTEINFGKDEGIQVILNILKSIAHSSWEKMWIKAVREAKMTLVALKVGEKCSSRLPHDNSS